MAAARALSDLGHRLLLTAAADIEAVCLQPARITW
ncbi:dsRBD fold-containing protein [Dactylosporangium sp. NPDC051541]